MAIVQLLRSCEKGAGFLPRAALRLHGVINIYLLRRQVCKLPCRGQLYMYLTKKAALFCKCIINF